MKQDKQLKQFLNSGIFYDPYLNLDKTIQSIQKLKNRKVKILYGETYDQYGLTIDSLKYYLVLNTLHNILEKQGYNVESNILVADTASARNDNVNSKKVLDQVQKNLELIKKIKPVFNIKSNIVLMSDVFKTRKFKSNFVEVTKCISDDRQIRNKLDKTVISSKLKEEKEKNFLYTREEVALILSYDIKIGPPREINYDIIAQAISKKLDTNKLIGIYVKPTYPLGKNFDFYLENPQIEEFGLTPYKAGSNRLQSNRIVLDNFNLEDLKKLIKETFIPEDKDLPNPVLDLQIILDLANKNIDSDFHGFKEYELENIKKIPKKLHKLIQRLR